MLKSFLLCFLLAASLTATGIVVPRPAGDVSWEVPGKGKDSLAKYKGKTLIFVVILTTCQHCQMTTKLLTSVQKDFKAMGVQVIEVTFTGSLNEVKDFITTYKPNFP